MMIRWSARILVSVLLLSLGYGSLVRAADTGRFPSGAGSFRPVYSAEAVRAGYTYYESESRIGRSMMVRRRTGDEPIAWNMYPTRPMTTQEFYGGRVREALDDRLRTAIAAGLDTAAVEQVGWPWPVWEREFRFRSGEHDPAKSRGHIAFGRFGIMTRPAWSSFLLWLPGVALVLWGIEWGARAIVRALRRLRVPYGHCVSCGYDLAGIDSSVCPECGGEQAERDRA